MSEFEVWIYRGAIVLLLMILWYLAKDVLQELKEIKRLLAVQNEQNQRHELQIQNFDKRLNDHGIRIKALEHKTDSCQYCSE